MPSTRFSTSELLVMYVYPETRSPDALSQLNAAAEAYARRHPEEPAKSAYKPPSARGKNTTPKKKSEDAVLGGGDDEGKHIRPHLVSAQYPVVCTAHVGRRMRYA